MQKLVIIIASLIFTVFNCEAKTSDEILSGAYGEILNKTEYNTEMLEKYFPPNFINGKNTGKPVYPNGDVDPKAGICADLVVRSLRNAGLDLQKLVHLDLLSNQKSYGVKTPDKYSDHRRVWILKTYFKRNWKVISTKLENPESWQPGDVVIWSTGSKRHLHIGILGKKKRHDGIPYVIHNMRYIPFVFAGKTIEQDIIEGPSSLWFIGAKWKILGHYRIQ